MIDSYEFGRLVIDGKTYLHDVIIHPEGVEGDWWRKEGHRLSPEDLPLILSENPDILIIGQGASGVMKVPPDVEAMIKERGIELIITDTRNACREYNRLIKEKGLEGKRIVAGLHLTC